MLRLEDLEYQRVLIQSNVTMLPRYNHTAAQLGSTLYIFGGMNQKMSLELSVQEFDLDQDTVNIKLAKQSKENEFK